MKRIMALLMAAILAAILIGCGQPKTDVQKYDYKRFRIVEQYKDLNVYVDTDTGIAYGALYDHGNSRVMFPLYDKDGNLYRPNGWRDWGGDDE